MKHIILLIILFFSCLTELYSQAIVFDKTTLQPIPDVVFTNKKNITVLSDEKGKIPSNAFIENDSVWIQMIGYESALIIWKGINEYKIYLAEKKFSLDEIIISASKFEEKKRDVPFQVEVIKSKFIQLQNPQNSGEMLQQTGNVFLQKSQMGGGSPVLRGFEANRVLLVVDGVRMNNAIYRSGHLQNVIRVDPQTLDRTEIIFGPSSVVYGSDALGGVVHLSTKKIQFSTTKPLFFSGSGMVRTASANFEKTGQLQFNWAGKKWGFFTAVTFSHFDDLRQGAFRVPNYDTIWKRDFYVERIHGKDSIINNSDPNIQKQSGYFQYDVLQKFSFQQNEKLSHHINLQLSNTGNVFRYDRLSEKGSNGKPTFAEWYYGPELRTLASYQIVHKNEKWFDEARITFAYQYIEESRHSRKFNNDFRKSQLEKLHIISWNDDFSKKWGKHELRFGTEFSYQHVNSSAFTSDVNTGNIGKTNTRYPDGGSHYYTAALYITDTWEIHQKVILNVGGRINFVGLNASFKDTTFFKFPFDKVEQNNVAGSGNIGVIYQPVKSIKLSILGSSGFRAPNVDDLGKVFDSRPGTLIVPNPSLRPEYTINGELGIWASIQDKAYIEINGYYTYAPGLISLLPYQWEGNDSIIYDGEKSKVYASQNADLAFITGGSIQLKAPITHFFTFSSSLTYTYGRILTPNGWTPLDHIPPLFGRTAITVSLKNFTGEFYMIYQDWKLVNDYGTGGEDNLQYATIHGTPAWFTINAKLALQINQYVGIQLGMENILDLNYRTFASGISAPGRNFIASVRANF